MRATIRDVARHPTWIGSWWLDLPWRRHPLRNLAVLLFEPGRGWLRWGMGTREDYEYFEGYVASCWDMPVAPPLRRLWVPVGSLLRWAATLGWFYHPHDRVWERFTRKEGTAGWAEARDLRDPDWPQDFWR